MDGAQGRSEHRSLLGMRSLVILSSHDLGESCLCDYLRIYPCPANMFAAMDLTLTPVVSETTPPLYVCGIMSRTFDLGTYNMVKQSDSEREEVDTDKLGTL